jgi:hypothetical protein
MPRFQVTESERLPIVTNPKRVRVIALAFLRDRINC